MLFRNKVGDIFARISSPKLSAQYAKAREADGHFKEAARAYEAAQDYDNAIRYGACIVWQLCAELKHSLISSEFTLII